MRLPSNLAAARSAWRSAENITTAAPCFRVENASKRAAVYVYDMIGGLDSDASGFVKSLAGIKAPTMDLHINSPGGFVFDAVAMFEAVRAHPARVVTHIDGLAASAASFLALAGDEVEIAKGGRMMIHDAQGVGIGSPAELREYADLLDEVSNDLAGFYADRAGGKPAAWRAAMSATTWYSAQQAVDAKLADRIAGTTTSGPDNRSRLITARHRALTALGG